MSYRVLSFPDFKFCQTAGLTVRKTLPSVSSCCVHLLICSSAWAIPANSWITICFFFSWTQWSQHFALSVHEGQWARGMCRWNLIDQGWTCSSFSVFHHGAVSRKVTGGRSGGSAPAANLSFVRKSHRQNQSCLKDQFSEGLKSDKTHFTLQLEWTWFIPVWCCRGRYKVR